MRYKRDTSWDHSIHARLEYTYWQKMGTERNKQRKSIVNPSMKTKTHSIAATLPYATNNTTIDPSSKVFTSYRFLPKGELFYLFLKSFAYGLNILLPRCNNVYRWSSIGWTYAVIIFKVSSYVRIFQTRSSLQSAYRIQHWLHISLLADILEF